MKGGVFTSGLSLFEQGVLSKVPYADDLNDPKTEDDKKFKSFLDKTGFRAVKKREYAGAVGYLFANDSKKIAVVSPRGTDHVKPGIGVYTDVVNWRTNGGDHAEKIYFTEYKTPIPSFVAVPYDIDIDSVYDPFFKVPNDFKEAILEYEKRGYTIYVSGDSGGNQAAQKLPYPVFATNGFSFPWGTQRQGRSLNSKNEILYSFFGLPKVSDGNYLVETELSDEYDAIEQSNSIFGLLGGWSKKRKLNIDIHTDPFGFLKALEEGRVRLANESDSGFVQGLYSDVEKLWSATPSGVVSDLSPQKFPKTEIISVKMEVGDQGYSTTTIYSDGAGLSGVFEYTKDNGVINSVQFTDNDSNQYLNTQAIIDSNKEKFIPIKYGDGENISYMYKSTKTGAILTAEQIGHSFEISNKDKQINSTFATRDEEMKVENEVRARVFKDHWFYGNMPTSGVSPVDTDTIITDANDGEIRNNAQPKMTPLRQLNEDWNLGLDEGILAGSDLP